MEYTVALEYFVAIEVFEARQALLDMKVADYPRATKESRSKFYRDVNKTAYPKELQKEMDFDEFFERMGHG